MVTAGTFTIPCFKSNVNNVMGKVNFKKIIRYILLRNFPLLYYLGMGWCYNTFLSIFLSISSGRLREVKGKRKFQTLSSKSGLGRLQDVPNIVIWLGNFLYFGKLVAGERWSQPEVRM